MIQRTDRLSFLLFVKKIKTIKWAQAVGLQNFMVDCEWKGKPERQAGRDTDTSHSSFEFIAKASAIENTKIHCRINEFGSWTIREIEPAIEAGAYQIFLPMVRSVKEVEQFLRLIDNRVKSAILVETDEAVNHARDLAQLPLDSVYVGFNDLAISRDYQVIFQPIIDGTLEYLRETFTNTYFGFGGATFLGCGHPCPTEFLLAEMNRLSCDFVFLRRSFYRDVQDRNVNKEIRKIHIFWDELERRSSIEKQHQKDLLTARINEMLVDREGLPSLISTPDTGEDFSCL
jgi:hypothetical protein